MNLPEVTPEAELAALGVRIIEAIVHDDLKFLFRAKERFDIGIDGEIEIVVDGPDNKRLGTGRLIAVQIKCGHHYFKEEKDDHFIFRGELKHLDYWLSSSLTVIVILCHPDTRMAYWAEINPGLIERTGSAWKIMVPKASSLLKSQAAIRTVAGRSYLRSVIDLAVQAWFHAKCTERVEFSGIGSMPREWSGTDHLITIGEREFQLQLIIARYGIFEGDLLSNVIRSYRVNSIPSTAGIIIALVAEHPSAFNFSDEVSALLSSDHIPIEVRRLLFNRHTCEIGELTADGRVELEYDGEKPLWSQSWDSFLNSRRMPHYIRPL